MKTQISWFLILFWSRNRSKMESKEQDNSLKKKGGGFRNKKFKKKLRNHNFKKCPFFFYLKNSLIFRNNDYFNMKNKNLLK